MRRAASVKQNPACDDAFSIHICRFIKIMLIGLLAMGFVCGPGKVHQVMATEEVRLFQAGILNFHHPASVKVKIVDTSQGGVTAGGSVLVEFDEDSFAAVEAWQGITDKHKFVAARATAIFEQIRSAFASRPEFPFKQLSINVSDETAENMLLAVLDYQIAEYPYRVESRLYRMKDHDRVFTLNAPQPPLAFVSNWCRKIRDEISAE